MAERKVTRNEYKKSIPDILNLFETQVQPLGDSGRRERIELGREYFWFFFKHYLPHYCSDNSPDFHEEIIDLLESDDEFISIAAPRGFSKSTLVSFAYVIWNVIREKNKFIVIVSATDDLAQDLSDFIRLEFTDNKRIREDFGSLLMGTGSANDFTVNKTRILARGKKQAIRGFRARESRPDLIILDDIEKDSEAVSPSVVAKTLEDITRGLIPSLPPKNRKLVLVGTILRTRSVVGTMLLSEDEPWNLWTRKIYRAIMPDGNGGEVSLWEDRFPLGFLHSQIEVMGRSAFNAEFQNMPSDDNNNMFQESMIIDGTNPPNSPMILFIDPSMDGVKKQDYKAGVLVSKHEDHYNIEGAVLVQGSDNKFFDGICDLFLKHKEWILGTYVESNSFQLYFARAINDFARERGVDLRISTMQNTIKKEIRINQLVPLFETERLTFDPEFRKTKEGKILVDQLLCYPNSKVHDDAPDALAGAVKVLESRTKKGGFTVLPKMPRKRRFFI